MKNRSYTVVVSGISPILFHHDDVEWSDRIAEARDQIKRTDKASFKAGDDRVPADTWKGYLYVDPDAGEVAIPTANFTACVVSAGAFVPLDAKRTCKQIMASGISLDSMYAKFRVRGKPITTDTINSITGPFSAHRDAAIAAGFELHVKRAKVGTAKHVRVRPMFRDWTAEIGFDVIDDQLTEDRLKEVWRMAGLRVGIGDWRPRSPSSPGTYGRFDYTLTRR